MRSVSPAVGLAAGRGAYLSDRKVLGCAERRTHTARVRAYTVAHSAVGRVEGASFNLYGR